MFLLYTFPLLLPLLDKTDRAKVAAGSFGAEAPVLGMKPEVSRIAQQLGCASVAEPLPTTREAWLPPAFKKKGQMTRGFNLNKTL